MKYVYSEPSPEVAGRGGDNGIDQVVINLAKHLPDYGWSYVENREVAHLFAPHAGSQTTQCDVAHCHGLYPTGVKGNPNENWMFEINRRVIANLKTAKQITVPSQWVADIVRRDMLIDPHVIGWGVNVDEWQNPNPQGYILWNKGRPTGVCDPKPLNELAKRAPQYRFMTTFGESMPNMKIIGRQPYETMKQHILGADVYLATTKETFGIATLEAMSAGIPVLGFNFGATPDFVVHGQHGYLAKPDDIDDLLYGLEYIYQHRDNMSILCKEQAALYDWSNVARRMGEVYDLADGFGYELPVSVVIPCYNYAHFLPDAVASVLNQHTTFDYEIILINDGSTDNSLEVMTNLEAENPNKIQVMTQRNLGVATTRNNAIARARGEYIVCLDADDEMGDGFLQTCYDAIKHDRAIGIVFTGIQTNGATSHWGQSYDYKEQLNRKNQIPSLCMFRKAAFERVGGYRKAYTPAEDAELWLRILTYGYTAKSATKEALFKYRLHDSSLSAPVRRNYELEPDWTADKDYIKLNPPMASDLIPAKHSHPVRNYDNPVVSVIIPVGKGHETNVLHAIDTVMTQTYWEWECIVVLDTPKPIDLSRYPFVKVYRTDDLDFLSSAKGASAARNWGIAHAKGEFVFFLDADDAILPDCLRKMVTKFRHTGKYVYSDWIQVTKQGTTEVGKALDNMSLNIFTNPFQHLNSCLIPTNIVKAVGMFDTSLESWEDVDLYMKLADYGLCGVRIDEPLVVYNYNSGTLRESGQDTIEQKKAILTERYSDYIQRGKKVMCGCTGVQKANGAIAGNESSGEMILAQYIGGNIGADNVKGAATGQVYKRLKQGDVKYIFRKDFEAMQEVFMEVSHFVAT